MKSYFTDVKDILELRRRYARLCGATKDDSELYLEISAQYREAAKRFTERIPESSEKYAAAH